jgi:anti-sigma B factor antagonist
MAVLFAPDLYHCMGGNMEIEHRKQGDAIIVNVLSNRLDAQGADEFKEKLSGLISDGNRSIILDISRVDFVDSSGLGAMVSVFKAIGEDGEMVICGSSEAAMRMFKLTRMNRVFRIFENEEDAVRALSKE